LQKNRSAQPRRHIGGQPQTPHTTYFQQPPPSPPKRPRRIIRNVLWSTFCFTAGAVTYVCANGIPSEMLANLGMFEKLALGVNHP
jgi:hypothetical protein